jgi:hypothetical protein
MTTTSLTPDTNELRRFSGLPTESALQRAAPFLARLVEDPAFVESEIFPYSKRRDTEKSDKWPTATMERMALTP